MSYKRSVVAILFTICWLVLCPGICEAQYDLYLYDATGLPGDMVDVSVNFSNNASAIQGWSMGVCSDPDLLEVVDVVNGSATATVNNGGPPDFVDYNEFPDGWNVGVLISFVQAAELPPGSDYELHVATYQLAADAPVAITELSFCDILGDPPVETEVVVQGKLIVPNTNSGTISIGNFHDFIRSDCNTLDGIDIADAIFLLNYLFLGNAQPICDDACDANDDAAVDIADVIVILELLFLGADMPPAPFPDCGPDPTEDLLECENFGVCP